MIAREELVQMLWQEEVSNGEILARVGGATALIFWRMGVREA